MLRAFNQAVKIRNPDPKLIVHTDRGSQYTSDDFVSALQREDFTLSMSRKGNCWDNAVVESFFNTLKTEEIRGLKLRTRWELQRLLEQYIDRYYNTIRMHSTLDYVSPREYEQNRKTKNSGEGVSPLASEL